MNLKKAILNYEKNALKKYYKILIKKQPYLKALKSSIYTESNFTKTETMVDSAYKLGDKPLTDDTLDEVMKKFEESDLPGFRQFLNDKVKQKRREWAKATIEFYQQLLSQEGKTNSFEEAVRQQFGDAEHYGRALKTIGDIEKSYATVLYETSPALSTTRFLEKTLTEAADECKENSVKKIFRK